MDTHLCRRDPVAALAEAGFRRQDVRTLVHEVGRRATQPPRLGRVQIELRHGDHSAGNLPAGSTGRRARASCCRRGAATARFMSCASAVRTSARPAGVELGTYQVQVLLVVVEISSVVAIRVEPAMASACETVAGNEREEAAPS